jgi:uncharacterized UPF0146 family protein
MHIRYDLSNRADDSFRDTLQALAAAPHVRRICEIGGGANPALGLEFVRRHELDYTIVDISRAELDKAPDAYHKVVADITDPGHGIPGGFDLIFSMWCAEHVRRGEVFHRHVYELLADGGRALHLFPTLFSPPFVLNRLVPEWLSHALLLLMQPHRHAEGQHGKFPAYYSWCRGPLRGQIRRLEGVGYRLDEYAAFFGHSGSVAYGAGYLDRFPPLRIVHEWCARRLVQHPVACLSTFAFVVLGKGDQRTAENGVDLDNRAEPAAEPHQGITAV